MSTTRIILKLTAVAAMFLVAAAWSSSGFAQTNLLVNADFEDTTGWGVPGDETLPANWTHDEIATRKNPAAQQTGVDAIGGSGTSAFMPSFPSSDNTTRRDMWNVGDPTWPEWTLEFDFACEDPGIAGDRSLCGAVEVTNSNRMTFRVTDTGDDGIGDLEIYNGARQPVLGSAVEFDADVSTTPVVNHITFTGRFNETSPVYDVEITNGLGTFTATDVAYYRFSVTSRPVSGAEGINFNTFNSLGDFLLDNIVLTHQEPVRPDQYIVNGDFEDTTDWGAPGTTYFPPGWTASGIRTNAAAMATGTGAIGGSGTSAYLEAYPATEEMDRREIRQSFTAPTTNDWQLDLDVAAEPTYSADDRSLSMEIDGFDGGNLLIRVVDYDLNGIGDLQFYTGTWQSVAELDNSIVFDDTLIDDLLANHLTIVGRYANATPTFDVLVTDANEVEHSATDLELWHGSAPSGGLGGVSGVSFNTYNSIVAHVIDNMSLVDIEPEPTIPGDADGDQDVDADDVAILAANWGGSGGWADGDFSGDGVINAVDASILAANWTGPLSEANAATGVPEPSTLVLLGIGAILLLRLRRLA